ncbi:hypothetical protein [Microvirga sp. VF16]|uniref:hypothetical protein n=1 Tax=Microvirga sp. VF16 TaxID=2807101 RepID=UPI00193D12EE|nr:hypothetical protein [Microvirga sp. VF16]QRM36032.1 hypothetical protein JO965_47605 [Microvirga sp. VF16]
MSSSPPRSPAPPVRRFEGAKTTTAIPARDRHVLDALIVASLDPAVRAIAPADSLTISLDGLPVQHVPDFRLQTDGQEIIVDVYRPSRAKAARTRFEAVAQALASQGIAYECREPTPIHGSPLVMNARSVWGCRHASVAAADQVAVLALLRQRSPLPLAEVAQVVRAGDPVSSILALVCRDLVEADLAAGPLGPDTPIRRRRLPPQSRDVASARPGAPNGGN